MEINEYLKEYLLECKIRNYSAQTIKAKKINLSVLIRYLKSEFGIDTIEKITVPFIYNQDERYAFGSTLTQPYTLAEIVTAREVFDDYDVSNLRFGYEMSSEDLIVPLKITTPSGYHSVKVLNLDGSTESESNIWINGGEVINMYEFYDRLKVGF